MCRPTSAPTPAAFRLPTHPGRQILRKNLAPRKASVPMEKHGSVALVQATLNNIRALKFVVDTGASYTLISNAVASDLGIDLGANPRTMPFQTANGLINAPITNIESISIGGLEIRNLAIAIHDAVPDPQIAGLLGLNFLTNFKTGYRYPEGISAFRKEVAESFAYVSASNIHCRPAQTSTRQIEQVLPFRGTFRLRSWA